MSRLSEYAQRLLAASGFAYPDEAPCPLCAGSDRAGLLYDAEQMAEHIGAVHDFEALYGWTRGFADACGQSHLVALLDTAFGVVAEYTTSVEHYVNVRQDGTVDAHWGWCCVRCWTSGIGFASEEAARADRVAHHSCPAPILVLGS